MEQKLKLRRLFDIKTESVSLVDKAANLKQFLIVKRNKQERKENSMEVQEALVKVEDALNDLSSRVEKLETGIFKFDTTELEKKGAKFSKETLTSLRSLHESLGKLLGNFEEEKGEVTSEAAASAITKGIQAALGEKNDKNKSDENQLTKRIVSAMSNALKSIQE